MKRFYFLLLSLLAAQVTIAQKTYSVNGTFGNTKKQGKIYCQHALGETYVLDTAAVKNGKFTLSGKIDDPLLVTINFKPDPVKTKGEAPKPAGRMDKMQLFMEPGTMELYSEDSLKYAVIKGSASHDVFLKLQTMEKPVTDRLDMLFKQYSEANKNNNMEQMKGIEEKAELIQKGEQADVYKSFIKSFPNSPVALYAIEQMAGYDIDVAQTEPFWNLIDEPLKNSGTGKKFSAKLDIARKIQPGQPAMDFTQNNTEGTPVKLSDFRGKYVLVDFWASWCGPCRKENPNVVKNYQKYKNKNFTVLGVSLDTDQQKDRWLKAIKDDQLEWTQVSDLKGWQNAAAIQYGIQAIPQNILVGPDGMIVAKNLREDKLTETLQKLLGE